MTTHKTTADRDTERLRSDREEQGISNRPDDAISGQDRPDDVDAAQDTEEDEAFEDDEDEDVEEEEEEEEVHHG